MRSSYFEFEAKLRELEQYLAFAQTLRDLLDSDERAPIACSPKQRRIVGQNRKLKNLFDLKLYAESADLVKQLKASSPERTVLRRFQYNSLIVSLYGAFERFVEGAIVNYSQRQNDSVKT